MLVKNKTVTNNKKDEQMINASAWMNLNNKGWHKQLHNVPFNLFNILEKAKL